MVKMSAPTPPPLPATPAPPAPPPALAPSSQKPSKKSATPTFLNASALPSPSTAEPGGVKLTGQ